jgi:hypothetical protein
MKRLLAYTTAQPGRADSIKKMQQATGYNLRLLIVNPDETISKGSTGESHVIALTTTP